MKPFRISNLQFLRKKQYLYRNPGSFPAIVFAMLVGTYLDLFFTGIGMYSFPIRPFADVFDIHIVFNLVGLPILIWFFLWGGSRMSKGGRSVLIIFLSLAGPVLEVFSESKGLFLHSEEWKHWYSFVGYFLFLLSVWVIFTKTNGQKS
ncbi:CBO0543 family protein [Bacillus norwichensis]|uniref:CBO0543 family protein n=1 Tax=Bacillus norwichensis TaxID=2762217 RepID=UPI00296EA70C|nr:CBO0543 family protein [Bacillus norwichensis]